ncbi:MAG TPA: transposase [Streptosporangiaceae bacterium]|nr:transposase [Streptosporangiaceae bacterium]
MHIPPQLDPIERALAERLPHLRGPQRRGLALWVLGAVLAQSACQAAVLVALLPWAPYHALRQRLREWLLDGADKAVPCAAQVEVERCFAPLLRWVLGWWRGRELALAVDATAHRGDVVALVVGVLYRGSAIPVAWAVLPGNAPGAWMGPILRLLRLLRPAVPAGWTVLVPADRGLWSPRLWKRVRDLGWHPLLRIQRRTTIAPDGGERRPAGALVRPGEAWVGRGRLGRPKGRGLTVTLVAVWTAAQEEPWVVVTDLPPDRVGVSWYALRAWVELGFRALKGVGWQWQRRAGPVPPGSRGTGWCWPWPACGCWRTAPASRTRASAACRRPGCAPLPHRRPPPARAGSACSGSGSSGCATCSREVDRGVGCGSLPSLGPSPRPDWRSRFPARRPELCRIPTPVSSRRVGQRALPASSASRSWTEAGTTATASQWPSASTSATRLRPSTFSPASWPRGPRTATHFTTCAPTMPRVGPGRLPALRRRRRATSRSRASNRPSPSQRRNQP